eukprot:COSAG05_NODE_133_length_17087_cov_268.363374_6_plen_82_part_00
MFEIAAKRAKKQGLADPMSPQEIEAIGDTIIQENKVLLDDIKATGQGVYVALCTESTKDREPYLGAAHTTLTTIATGEEGS